MPAYTEMQNVRSNIFSRFYKEIGERLVRLMKILNLNSPVVSMMLCAILLLFALCSPNALCQVPVTNVDFSSSENEIPITRWQLLGPFRFDEKEIKAPGADDLPVGLGRDYLRDFGQNETAIDAQTFPLLNTPTTGTRLNAKFGNVPISADPKTNILLLSSSSDNYDYAVSYAAVILSSPRDQDIVLALGADDNAKVWLNHELLWADANTRQSSIRKFQHLIGAHLRKGDNFLLLKVGNLTGFWEAIVTILPHNKDTLEIARENAVDPILIKEVVLDGQPLELRGDLLPASTSLHLEISDAKHRVIDKDEVTIARKMSWNLARLEKDKLYYCRIRVAGQIIQQPFYYGDVDVGFRNLSELANHVSVSDELLSLDLSLPLNRLRYLLLPNNRTALWWDQKVVTLIAEVENNLADLAVGVHAFRSAPGTHLRAYRSSVDGQIQDYWIHIPSKTSRTGNKIPLVIVLPWGAKENPPFLETYQMAEFDENERYSQIGDQYGYAVMQVWGRGVGHGGTAISNTDIFKALDAVRHDYPIDIDRIYLTGVCEGGRQALLLAERYPERFAAVAVDDPITNIRRRPAFDALWVQYASPISQAGNLINMPVFIIHDEEGKGMVSADREAPLADSESFVNRIREAGGDATLKLKSGGFHGFTQNSMADRRAVFEFFNGKRRSTSPRKIEVNKALQRFGTGKGPIEDAFGSPILLVEGTQGTPEQNLAVRSAVEEFRNDWRDTYYVECPWKRDADVTDQDILNKNLVVIGDEATNSLLRRIAGRLPIQKSQQGISIESKDVNGDQLGYVFISPNPLNSNKYLVVIGMTQWKPVNVWKLNLSRNGVCDYFVFDLRYPTPRLINAGYFDATWLQPKESMMDALPTTLREKNERNR